MIYNNFSEDKFSRYDDAEKPMDWTYLTLAGAVIWLGILLLPWRPWKIREVDSFIAAMIAQVKFLSTGPLSL